MKHRFISPCLAVGFTLSLVSVNHGAALATVSGVASPNLAGADASSVPLFSADGRSLLFISRANNLVTNDDRGPFLDLFLRNLDTQQTTLISVNLSGQGGGNGDTRAVASSSNGQYVVFASAADNLWENDTNGGTDIFLRDLVQETTDLVSVDWTGTNNAIRTPFNNSQNVPLCANPLLSADGRWVAFESTATTLVAGFPDLDPFESYLKQSIYVRDLEFHTTAVLSTNLDAIVGNPDSELEAITPDGRFVLFTSWSSGFPSWVAPIRKGEIFVRDLQINRTYWVSSNAPSFFIESFPPEYFYENMHNASPAISADGQFVVFRTERIGCSALDSAWVFHHDVDTGSTLLITSNALCSSLLQISADGRFVAYATGGQETTTNVFLWDFLTQSNHLISVTQDGLAPGNGPSRLLSMTSDGLKVLFLSSATDLVTNTVNGLSQIYWRDLETGITRLVSANQAGAGTAEDLDYSPIAMSSEGRQVAFETRAADWGAQDRNQTADVYLWNADTESIVLMSQRHPDLPEGAGLASVGLSFASASVNANGRYVAMESFDSLFAEADTNLWKDSFVRDIQTGQIWALHQDEYGQLPSHLASIQPTISSDGRSAIFFSYEPEGGGLYLLRWDPLGGSEVLDFHPITPYWPYILPPVSLSPDGTRMAFLANSNSYRQVFLYDFAAQTNLLISAQPSGQPGTDHSQNPSFSPDGRWLLFESRAELLPGEADNPHIYARDLVANQLRAVSQPDTYERAYGAVVSADSRWVAYQNVTLPGIVLYDLLGGTNRSVCTYCLNPSLSGDGRFIVYAQNEGGFSNYDLLLHDLETAQIVTLVSNHLGGSITTDHATGLQISHDARFAVFASPVNDLVEDDDNETWDVFVYDRLNATTLLISRNYLGTGSGNGASSHPVLAADGKTVVFQSAADDLVANDFNHRLDVFLLRLGGPDSDGDGLDDDWEMAYFGTLERDGTGDYDQDGHTDAQEFQAGTNPIDDASILRVLALSLAGGDQTTLLWSAVPGRTYRLQYKASVEDPDWIDLPGDVLATATYATKVDVSAGLAAKRFYRVTLSPPR